MVISNESITSHSKLLYWGVITKGWLQKDVICFFIEQHLEPSHVHSSIYSRYSFCFCLLCQYVYPIFQACDLVGVSWGAEWFAFLCEWQSDLQGVSCGTEWFAGGFMWDTVICWVFREGQSDLLGVSWGAEWFAAGFVWDRVICLGFHEWQEWFAGCFVRDRVVSVCSDLCWF